MSEMIFIYRDSGYPTGDENVFLSTPYKSLKEFERENKGSDYQVIMVYDFNSILKWSKTFKALESRLAIAVDALNLYACENNWEGRGSSVFLGDDLEDYILEDWHSETQEMEYILEDQIMGRTAREALKKIKGME